MTGQKLHVTLFLVGVTSVIAMIIMFMVMDQPQKARQSIDSSVIPVVEEKINNTSLTSRKIRSWELFGNYNDFSEKYRIKSPNEVNADIKLLGVFREMGTNSGRVILRRGSNDWQIYAVGDWISQDMLIAEIGYKSILIRRNDKEETLSLIGWGGSVDAVLKDEVLAESKVHTLAADDPGSGYSSYKGSNKEGFQVTSKRAGIVKDLGLKEGDVLLSINGYPMVTLDDVALALRSMQQASRSTAVILREGREIRKSYGRR